MKSLSPRVSLAAAMRTASSSGVAEEYRSGSAAWSRNMVVNLLEADTATRGPLRTSD